MTAPRPQKRYRCRHCGTVLPAWWPVAEEPNAAMLLSHLSQRHPEDVGAYLARIHTDEDIDTVVLEAFEALASPRKDQT
jgi:hypothetical protein